MSQYLKEDCEINLPPAGQKRPWRSRRLVKRLLPSAVMRYGVLSLCLLLILAVPVLATKDNVWSIGPRTLPPPTGVSDELRKALSKTPSPNIEAAKASVPKTIEAWKAFIAKTDASGATNVQARAEQLSTTIQEDTIAGVRVYRVTPPQINPQHAKQLFVYIHGGGFVLGGGLASVAEGNLIASRMGIPLLAIDYRLAPDNPAPAAMEDIMAVWRALIAERPAGAIALGGTSAGGNLTLVSTLKLKELGLALPGALFVGTPAVDLAKRGDSRFINEGIDRRLVTWDALAAAAIALYARDKSYDDPYLSPIFGDVGGFPPTYLISGTRDLMLSDTVRIHRKLRRAGVEADLHIYEGHSHGDYSTFNMPETEEHLTELQAFLLRHLNPT